MRRENVKRAVFLRLGQMSKVVLFILVLFMMVSCDTTESNNNKDPEIKNTPEKVTIKNEPEKVKEEEGSDENYEAFDDRIYQLADGGSVFMTKSFNIVRCNANQEVVFEYKPRIGNTRYYENDIDFRHNLWKVSEKGIFVNDEFYLVYIPLEEMKVITYETLGNSKIYFGQENEMPSYLFSGLVFTFNEDEMDFDIHASEYSYSKIAYQWGEHIYLNENWPIGYKGLAESFVDDYAEIEFASKGPKLYDNDQEIYITMVYESGDRRVVRDNFNRLYIEDEGHAYGVSDTNVRAVALRGDYLIYTEFENQNIVHLYKISEDIHLSLSNENIVTGVCLDDDKMYVMIEGHLLFSFYLQDIIGGGWQEDALWNKAASINLMAFEFVEGLDVFWPYTIDGYVFCYGVDSRVSILLDSKSMEVVDLISGCLLDEYNGYLLGALYHQLFLYDPGKRQVMILDDQIYNHMLFRIDDRFLAIETDHFSEFIWIPITEANIYEEYLTSYDFVVTKYEYNYGAIYMIFDCKNLRAKEIVLHHDCYEVIDAEGNISVWDAVSDQCIQLDIPDKSRTIFLDKTQE